MFIAAYVLLNMFLNVLNLVSFSARLYLFDVLNIFVATLLVPGYLLASIKCVFATLRNPAFGMLKNLSFFLMVLMSLLIRCLSFAVWNLDSIYTSEYARIPLIETLQATYSFDLFGVCESSLRPDIPNEDICIGGFPPESFRSDKPINTRNEGVCLCYKENLPIKRRVDLELLNETIVAEVNINR